MNPEIAKLIEAAQAARQHAYAPYSNYRVGAAVLTASGRIYSGCNIENASYSMTICAERVAVATAIAAGETEFVALAVAGGQELPSLPCGACRQFLAEFAGPELPVSIVSQQGTRLDTTLGELLPKAFDPTYLQEGKE
ncbi:MAG: cytidine deaminase [Bacillota bacterium]|jgi:cytidine deaminase